MRDAWARLRGLLLDRFFGVLSGEVLAGQDAEVRRALEHVGDPRPEPPAEESLDHDVE